MPNLFNYSANTHGSTEPTQDGGVIQTIEESSLTKHFIKIHQGSVSIWTSNQQGFKDKIHINQAVLPWIILEGSYNLIEIKRDGLANVSLTGVSLVMPHV